MLSPENIEEKIGFDQIRSSILQLCKTVAGKKYVHQIEFSTDKSSIQALLNQVSQFQKILQSETNVPESSHADAGSYLKNIKTAGTFLEAGHFLQIEKALREGGQWLKFLKKNEKSYPDLFILGRNIPDLRNIRKEISNAIDTNGEIRNSASPALKKIRSELISYRLRARKMLDQMVSRAKSEDLIPTGASLTVRNGRLVIPVKAEYKRSFRGFIHDESSTGSIVYIEPSDVLDLNNAIRDLEYQEKREIIRILTQLTDMLRPEVPALQANFDLLAVMDFIHAKAVFSNNIKAIPPLLNDEKHLRWIKAVHPLLKETLSSQGKQIVPLDIEMGARQRILVISGPNAGGKSVCLKTVGLLQYMLQCGFHIPVAEGSESPVFKDILIDIGDEQSIENDLSTYSSHLKNLAGYLRYGSEHSLFLIDEFGSGTDPLFGGAIAESLLEALYDKGMYGLVTTHYGNLKKMAELYSAMVNARMRFDVQNLEPLFQLETGKPGSSFSLEIAGKIGLPPEVLAKARKKIGTDPIDMESLLNQLETEKKYFEDKNREIRSKQRILDRTLKNYEDLKRDLEIKKKKILNEAKTEALNLLKITNRKTENLIRLIRENRAEKERTKILRKELKDYEKAIRPEPLPEIPHESISVLTGKIRAGDQVRVKGQSTTGEVQDVQKRKAMVIFGNMKTQIALSRLEKVKVEQPSETPDKATEKISLVKGVSLNEKMAVFTSELDLRGKRGMAARAELIRFLDEAVMLGVPSVKIIHGKGGGILRKIVQEELKSRKDIRNTAFEHADRGGDGVTIVTF